jgi:isoleucyl-tRNA synthetase
LGANVGSVEREGYAALTAEDSVVTLVLDMTTTPELLSKGLAREIIRRVQQKRKDLNLEVDATITLSVWLGDGNPDLLEADWTHVCSEVRAAASNLTNDTPPADADHFEVDGASIHFNV